jgi:hypothetical protein
MSSTDNPHVADEQLLDPYIEAARRQFDAASLDDAAQRLRNKLPLARKSARPLFGWPSLAAAAAVAFVAISAVSFFLPGDNGSAFAQAQQWLQSFRTLQAETTVLAGDSASTVVAWLDESGDTRVESLGTTTIIKPDTGMIYIMPPDGQYFAQRISPERIVGNSTELLDNIRAFRGQAELLAETRVIDGISAVGYALEIDSATNVLWVDPMDGRPLLVVVQTPNGVIMRTVLRFDVPLPDNAFDVPDGIQPAQPIQ